MDYIILSDRMIKCLLNTYKYPNNKDFRDSIKWFYYEFLRKQNPNGGIIKRYKNRKSYIARFDKFIDNNLIQKRIGGFYFVKCQQLNKYFAVYKKIFGFGDLTNFANSIKPKDISKFQNVLYTFTKMDGVIRINGEYYV